MHDYVMLWDAVALELNRRDHTGKMNARNQRGPTRSSRALAIVHIAMHDAFFGIPGTLPPGSTIAGLAGPITPFLNLSYGFRLIRPGCLAWATNGSLCRV